MPLSKSTKPPIPLLPAVMAIRAREATFPCSPAASSFARTSSRGLARCSERRFWLTKAILGSGLLGNGIASLFMSETFREPLGNQGSKRPLPVLVMRAQLKEALRTSEGVRVRACRIEDQLVRAGHIGRAEQP